MFHTKTISYYTFNSQNMEEYYIYFLHFFFGRNVFFGYGQVFIHKKRAAAAAPYILLLDLHLFLRIHV